MNLPAFDTIAAIATASGQGAIGLIRVSGPQAIPIVDSVFSKDLSHAQGHSLHFGKIVLEDGKVLDEVLVSIFRAPRSFTKEDVCEISFHGSPFILREALSLLCRKGVRPAHAGEFTQRAFVNGAMDLAQAEAVADLIASTTARAHDLAYKQMKGGVSTEIGKLRDRLLHFTSLLELELDFAEEDVEFADRGQLLALLEQMERMASRLAGTFHVGNAIKEGIPTVIAGRPNAGKSTLLNALLQEERAIVSDIPGTTRDTIEEAFVVDGILFRLVDTAGIRETQDSIEAIGVERTLASIRKASILIYLYDAPATTQAQKEEDLAALSADHLKVIVAANKWDVMWTLHDNLLDQATRSLGPDEITLSARGNYGLDQLKAALVKAATEGADLQSEVIISNVRHLRSLEQAVQSLKSATEAIHNGLTQELVSIDIRQAIHHLGEITGQITTDEVLGNIFSKFCIGK